MQIRSEQEAIYVACEMERSAVQIYERALMLVDTVKPESTPLRQQLELILADERQHLQQFCSLYQGLDTDVEQQLMLSAIASAVLFKGGLMGAVRQGMLKDTQSLLAFATDAEQKAAEAYRSFARSCADPQTAAILNGIAAEEDKHLQTLLRYQ